LQISLKIYDIAQISSVCATVQCTSTTNFSRIDENVRVLLRDLKPATEITDVKVQNESMISFKLDSTTLSAGLKIITAQTDSQVYHEILRIYHSNHRNACNGIFSQVFQQQLCFNVTMNEHLTAQKLIEIMSFHKENARSPFIDENLQLNQRHMFSDINVVISSSASCTSEGTASIWFSRV
jgi:hypothetical protein